MSTRDENARLLLEFALARADCREADSVHSEDEDVQVEDSLDGWSCDEDEISSGERLVFSDAEGEQRAGESGSRTRARLLTFYGCAKSEEETYSDEEEPFMPPTKQTRDSNQNTAPSNTSSTGFRFAPPYPFTAPTFLPSQCQMMGMVHPHGRQLYVPVSPPPMLRLPIRSSPLAMNAAFVRGAEVAPRKLPLARECSRSLFKRSISIKGRRAVFFGLQPGVTTHQVKECFQRCGEVELSSLIDDSQIRGLRHIALLFASDKSAKNAVRFAQMTDFPQLGGRIGAALADEKFSVSGRIMKIDFGVMIPFDQKAQEGLLSSFDRALRVVQNENNVDILFPTYKDAQMAEQKAKQMNLNVKIV